MQRARPLFTVLLVVVSLAIPLWGLLPQRRAPYPTLPVSLAAARDGIRLGIDQSGMGLPRHSNRAPATPTVSGRPWRRAPLAANFLDSTVPEAARVTLEFPTTVRSGESDMVALFLERILLRGPRPPILQQERCCLSRAWHRQARMTHTV
jgi:hypothetical protein